MNLSSFTLYELLTLLRNKDSLVKLVTENPDEVAQVMDSFYDKLKAQERELQLVERKLQDVVDFIDAKSVLTSLGEKNANSL